MVHIYRDVIYSHILEPLSIGTRQELQKKLSYTEVTFRYDYRTKSQQRKLVTHNLFGRSAYRQFQAFPTGLLNIVLKSLEEQGIGYKVTDISKTTNSSSIFDEYISGDIVLRDYQEAAIQAALDKKFGIISCPTGSGKTVILGEIVKAVNKKPTLIAIYHSKELLRQTMNRMETQLGTEVGIVGDGSMDLKDVTVGMTDTIAKALKKGDNKELQDYLTQVKLLIFDETHHARAETIQAISKACPNVEYRIGASATPVRDNGDDLEIFAYVGPIIYNRTITDLVDKGWLVPPTIYFIEIADTSIPTHKNLPNYQKTISEYICNNPIRDGFIADMAVKLESLGHKGLVLVEQVEHGSKLQAEIPRSEFIHGGDATSYREKIIKDLTNGNTKTVVATSIMREGVDIPPASYLIHGHPFKSFVVTWQRNGRVLRPYNGKSKAIIVDIADTHNKWLSRHAKNRLYYYEKEPCFTIKKKRVVL